MNPSVPSLIREYKYKDCIHVHETGCNVLENMDKVAKSRYESYKKFVEEAKEFKQKIKGFIILSYLITDLFWSHLYKSKLL